MKKISNIIKTLATTLFLMANPYVCGMEEYINDDDKAMKSLLWQINNFNYHLLRTEAIRLVYKGANTAIVPNYSLLQNATLYNDLEMVKILLINQANPYNKKYEYDDPDFFHIKTVEMAQVYATHGVNLNAPNNTNHPNILYRTIIHNPSSKLIKFYIDNKVDTNVLHNHYVNEGILHYLIYHAWAAHDIDDYINIGKVILDANPLLINIRTTSGKSLIEYAQNLIQRSSLLGREYKIREKLITLFKQYECNINNQQPATFAQHDKTNRLLTLPHNILATIISHCDNSKSLQKIMPSVLSLSATCKQFDAILPTIIGQYYNYDEKNTAMCALLRSMNKAIYRQQRRAALLLTHAGANNAATQDYCSLLLHTIFYNDTEMANEMLKNNADPNQKQSKWDIPDFFSIETVEMAQLFATHGVNFNAPGSKEHPNILYSTILHRPSSKLVKSYLDNNVNTNPIHYFNGNNILHYLVFCAWNATNINDYVKIGELLTNANPDLINKFNKYGETPLDYAQKKLTQYPCQWYIDSNKYKIYEKLIALFKQHGGKTALQLKQLENNDNNQQSDCIICFETYDKMLNIPCPNEHPDRICAECLQALSSCPLCNAILKK